MKIFFALLFVFITLTLSRSPSVNAAIECDGSLPDDEARLKEYIAVCESKVNELRAEKHSLAATISLLNSKINLTQAQIRSTNSQIDQITKEINVLSTVIEDLNTELDALTRVYLSRVREAYKNRHSDSLLSLLSESGTDFQARLKYLETAHRRDQVIMRELEAARISYDQQKTTKEEKQIKIENLKTTLEQQKLTLAQQQQGKQILLTNTQNDERKYQDLLSRAQRQLAAFRRFVTDQGGASILSNQTRCDDWGCYYNQRDSLWGNLGLGGSSYSVAEYGCLVTSISMVASHYGKDIKPDSIAINSNFFVPGTGYLYHSAAGMPFSLTWASRDQLDKELEKGPVIVGLYSGPDHFIVITKKEGGNYYMHDPFMPNGYHRPLTDKYNVSSITSLRLVRF